MDATKITKHILRQNQEAIVYNESLEVYSNNEFMIKSEFCTFSKYFNKKHIIKNSNTSFKKYFNSKDIAKLNGNVVTSYFIRINKIPLQVIEFKEESNNSIVYISKDYYRYLAELKPMVYINSKDVSEPIRLVIDDKIIGLIMPVNIKNN